MRHVHDVEDKTGFNYYPCPLSYQVIGGVLVLVLCARALQVSNFPPEQKKENSTSKTRHHSDPCGSNGLTVYPAAREITCRPTFALFDSCGFGFGFARVRIDFVSLQLLVSCLTNDDISIP